MGRKVFEVDEDRPTITPEFEVGGEVFLCRTDAEVSSLDVLDAIDAMTGDNGLERLRAMLRVFRHWIPNDDGTAAVEKDGEVISKGTPSSMERFRDVILRKRVRLETLNDIASWVVDEYLRFPTDQAPDQPSSNGSTPDVSSSEAGSSLVPASTSAT